MQRELDTVILLDACEKDWVEWQRSSKKDLAADYSGNVGDSSALRKKAKWEKCATGSRQRVVTHSGLLLRVVVGTHYFSPD